MKLATLLPSSLFLASIAIACCACGPSEPAPVSPAATPGVVAKDMKSSKNVKKQTGGNLADATPMAAPAGVKTGTP